MYQYFMDSPIGRLRLVESDGFIKEISRADVPAARLDSEGKIIKTAETFESAVTEKTEALAETEQQLREYFAGIRKSFDVLLKPDGTAFFQSVWKALLDIPYGETRTYGDIAKAVGKPKAARAVGMDRRIPGTAAKRDSRKPYPGKRENKYEETDGNRAASGAGADIRCYRMHGRLGYRGHRG